MTNIIRTDPTCKIYFVSDRFSEGLSLIRKKMRYKTEATKTKKLAGSIQRGAHDPNAICIAWGSTNLSPAVGMSNKARLLSDKRNFFRRVNELSTRSNKHMVENTTIKDLAKGWLEGGSSVVCRHLLNAHSGEGIEIINPGETLPEAPLYTKYFKKSKEFRVHAFYDRYTGKVRTFSARKVLPAGTEAPDKAFQIRTSTYGWKYTSKEAAPDSVIEAVTNLVLDFGSYLEGTYFCGGFDVILRANNSFRILECNATPGMSEVTAEWYATMFGEMIDSVLKAREARKATSAKQKYKPSMFTLDPAPQNPVSLAPVSGASAQAILQDEPQMPAIWTVATP